MPYYRSVVWRGDWFRKATFERIVTMPLRRCAYIAMNCQVQSVFRKNMKTNVTILNNNIQFFAAIGDAGLTWFYMLFLREELSEPHLANEEVGAFSG